MSDGIGYLLPDGDAYEEDLQCMLLFYPNRRKYRQALYGSLDYLGTWLAWEKDDAKRGKDAALSWKLANIATRECNDMATCDTIINLLTQIEKNTRTCCGQSDYVQYGPNVITTTTIIPGFGPDPTLYGETSVADWDEWMEYVCYHAHAYVDDLIETAEKLHTAVTIGGYVLDFIAHLFSIVQWRMVEDLVPVNFSVIQAIFNALGEAGIVNEFDDLADDFETYRDDIVCSLMQGTSLEDAVYAVVGAGVLWDTYYQWLDYETTTAVIYEGQLPGVGYLTPIKKDDCVDCGSIGEYLVTYEFDTTSEGWNTPGNATWTGTYGNPVGSLIKYKSGGDTGTARLSIGNLRAAVGLGSSAGDWVKIYSITFEVWHQAVGQTQKVTLGHTGADTVKTYINQTSWLEEILTWPAGMLWTDGTDGYIISSTVTAGNGQWCAIDNVVIDFDANL